MVQALILGPVEHHRQGRKNLVRALSYFRPAFNFCSVIHRSVKRHPAFRRFTVSEGLVTMQGLIPSASLEYHNITYGSVPISVEERFLRIEDQKDTSIR
jgi:hypothetical protein